MVRQIMKYLPFKLFKLKYHSGLKFVKCQRKTLFIMRPSFTYLHCYFTLQFCLRRDYILRIKNKFYILLSVYRTINKMHSYCKFVFLLKEVFWRVLNQNKDNFIGVKCSRPTFQMIILDFKSSFIIVDEIFSQKFLYII